MGGDARHVSEREYLGRGGGPGDLMESERDTERAQLTEAVESERDTAREYSLAPDQRVDPDEYNEEESDDEACWTFLRAPFRRRRLALVPEKREGRTFVE